MKHTEKISELLFEEWDPIGVKAAGAPPDHYKRYAKEIVARFGSGASQKDIQAYLQEAYLRCLGDPETDHSKSLRVSGKIREILAS